MFWIFLIGFLVLGAVAFALRFFSNPDNYR